MLLNVIKAIILGAVQGIAGWLPISGSGHLIIFNGLFGLDGPSGFFSLFMAATQFAAVLAMAFLFKNRLNLFSAGMKPAQKKSAKQLWCKLIISSLPIILVGGLLGGTIGELFHTSVFTASVALIIYGLLFGPAEKRISGKEPQICSIKSITPGVALILGFAQLLALVPGTSRLAVIILAALILGFSRPTAIKFATYMSLPVSLGALIYEIIRFASSHPNIDSLGSVIWSDVWGQFFITIFGMASAFLISVIFVKRFLAFLESNSLNRFGVYRIALGSAALIILAITAIF